MPEPTSVEAQLAVINTKLDLLIEQRAEDRDVRDKAHLDHENRLRRLEQFKWTLVGVAVAAGGAAGQVASRL